MFKAKINPRRVITTGGTLFCALGIGYLMQSNAQEAVPQAQGLSTPEVKVEPLVKNDQKKLTISEITLTSAIEIPDSTDRKPVFFPDAPLVKASLVKDAPIAALPVEQSAPSFVCIPELTAKPAAAAMVTLTLDAPCMINDHFTVHHNGMMFTEVTDTKGHSTLTVPALSGDAVYIVSFPNGEGAVAKTKVTSLEYYHRVVVQWAGDSGLQIHALEFGADYQGPGHVWADDPQDISIAARGQGGFLTRLGVAEIDNARMAEIYTFPAGTSLREGEVHLSLETEITKANCGRDIEAQSLQTGVAGHLKVRDVVLAVPDCNAVGDFLVLKNFLNDLKIARN